VKDVVRRTDHATGPGSPRARDVRGGAPQKELMVRARSVRGASKISEDL
jgi:hypothetical protein